MINNLKWLSPPSVAPSKTWKAAGRSGSDASLPKKSPLLQFAKNRFHFALALCRIEERFSRRVKMRANQSTVLASSIEWDTVIWLVSRKPFSSSPCLGFATSFTAMPVCWHC